ncbi:enoyl-CoA hydratase/isomerase family protein [Roseovarius sp. LXJ103]|uniref:enoyl-CoA hydratase/isomerase family protein n=1 Tax=Roseovarius carneus TaxID=2853164 RepID=UPI000D61E3E6|nr:enoyl-CoA hydratase/isomerase family protein [Roseovarius carneus]MBZ8118163.1 enoyl-CoA hydratase/isomerase family protein [Roseovarius carneus]PWE36105.1 enoyl-CoA hydratase [Pelagicola sp. LXJ1103]
MIDLQKEGGIWTATINRPEKANSLTEAMLAELGDIALAATDARALILTGEGRVFSAGADFDAARAGLATSPLWERLSGAIAPLPCLTIAALNGTVAGGAVGMALACDLRIAVPGAKIFYPVMKLGFLPQPSDPPRMARLIGPARTKMIFMAGQKIDTETATAWGLFDQIVEADMLLDASRALAQDSISATPAHAAAIKGMIP